MAAASSSAGAALLFKRVFPINPNLGLKSGKRKREEEEAAAQSMLEGLPSSKQRRLNQNPIQLQKRNAVLKELRTPHKVMSADKRSVERQIYPAEAIVHRIRNLEHWDRLQRTHPNNWKDIVLEELSREGMPITLAPQETFVSQFGEEGAVGWLKANNKQTLRRYQQLYLLYELATIQDLEGHFHELAYHQGGEVRQLAAVMSYSPQLQDEAQKLWEDIRSKSLRVCWARISHFGQRIGSSVFCDQARIRFFNGTKHTPLCRKTLRHAIVMRSSPSAPPALSEESLVELVDIHTCVTSMNLPIKSQLPRITAYVKRMAERLHPTAAAMVHQPPQPQQPPLGPQRQDPADTVQSSIVAHAVAAAAAAAVAGVPASAMPPPQPASGMPPPHMPPAMPQPTVSMAVQTHPHLSLATSMGVVSSPGVTAAAVAVEAPSLGPHPHLMLTQQHQAGIAPAPAPAPVLSSHDMAPSAAAAAAAAMPAHPHAPLQPPVCTMADLTPEEQLAVLHEMRGFELETLRCIEGSHNAPNEAAKIREEAARIRMSSQM